MLCKSLPRNQDGSNQESEERECPKLCFHDVSNDIDLELTTCSINTGRSKRNIKEQAMKRLIGGTTTFAGSFPYVVRLAFQTFDQFHSDSQVWSQLDCILIFKFIYLHQFQDYFKQYNLCAGTVIDQHWILTSATCCKRDDIVTITFNDYSIFYNDQNQNEIISTIFHIHQDYDACLIRTTDISNMVTHIPCLTKVKFQLFIAVVRETLTLKI